MLELVMMFLLSSICYFVARLEKPSTFWEYFDAGCPIVMGVLAVGIIHKNV
ncbi:hypothetical protein KR054_005931, partial [Drosophila jambulina]